MSIEVVCGTELKRDRVAIALEHREEKDDWEREVAGIEAERRRQRRWRCREYLVVECLLTLAIWVLTCASFIVPCGALYDCVLAEALPTGLRAWLGLMGVATCAAWLTFVCVSFHCGTWRVSLCGDRLRPLGAPEAALIAVHGLAIALYLGFCVAAWPLSALRATWMFALCATGLALWPPVAVCLWHDLADAAAYLPCSSPDRQAS